jgi:uncharacterized protein (UPF0332 family)
VSRKALADYRIERAKEILVEAKDTLKQKHYKLSVNRSYYAMFTAAKALLALKEKNSAKHSGVISLFNKYIIKNDLFPKKLSKYLPKAKDLREDADYVDFINITKDDAILQLERATEFIKEAEKAISKMLKKPEK